MAGGQTATFVGFDEALSLEDGAEVFLEAVVELAGKWFLLSATAFDSREGPAALLAALAEDKGERQATSRGLLQSTAVGAQFVSALVLACPRDAADCVFLCISAGFETEVFGPLVLFISAYEGNECDCKKVFPASEGSSTERPYMVGRVRFVLWLDMMILHLHAPSSIPPLRG